jgi:hypothetical protein
MKRIYKTETIRRVLPVLLLMCSITPGLVWSAEIVEVTPGPVTGDVAIMLPGQSKSYTIESELYPALAIIPVVIFGSGGAGNQLSITMSKTDTSGELFGVMQVGGYNTLVAQTKYGATVGVTPRSISLAARSYDIGFIVVVSGLLVSTEEGPHRYSISLSVN